jgi:hypothetical protein
MYVGPEEGLAFAKRLESIGSLLVAVALVFAVGHLIMAVLDHALRPAMRYAQGFSSRRQTATQQSAPYSLFVDLLKKRFCAVPWDSWELSDLRSFAMTASREAASLGRRFKSLSLLCDGVGAALVLLAIVFLCAKMFSPETLFMYEYALPEALQILLILVSSTFLFRRGSEFRKRADAMPFLAAAVHLALTDPRDESCRQ